MSDSSDFKTLDSLELSSDERLAKKDFCSGNEKPVFYECSFCGSSFVRGKGAGRVSSYCSDSCRKSRKHLDLFISNFPSTMTAKNKKLLRGQFFQFCNQNLRSPNA